MFSPNLIAVSLLLTLVTSENQDSIISHYVKLFEEYNKNVSSYQFPQDNAEFFDNMKDDTIHDYGSFDFIIIGAGSSGTVIANRLTEISSWRILLIEAGGEEDDFSDIPGTFIKLQGSRMNWGYLSTPQSKCCLGMKNRQCVQPRGKVVGGSSSINALMYVRGNREDYDKWEALGNIGWNYKNVLPYFIKSENSQIYFNNYYHGNDGPMVVNYPEPPSELLQSFVDGNEELGRQYLDYNGRRQLGFSRTQLNTKDGRRVSGGNAYIKPILERKNLNISMHSLVTKLIIRPIKPLRVDGVEFIKDGIKFKAHATKEVILSAGAFNSPQILLLSGIGPRNELRNHNISVMHHLPAVGKNLKDHALFTGLTFHTNFTQVIGTPEELLRQYLKGEGLLTSPGPTSVIGFIETKNWPNGIPDIEYVLEPPVIRQANPDIMYNYNDKLLRQYMQVTNATSDMLVLLVVLHPKSSGEITLVSKDPKDFPKIDPNYFSDVEDVETMYRGVRFIQKLMGTEAFKKVNTTQYTMRTDCDRLGTNSKEFWYCYIRTMTSTIYHPVGTTRMGPSPHDSVVDHRLFVHGINNLRVADAGVIPSTISGHTSAPAFMIGERVSDFIKRNYGIKRTYREL